MAGNKCSGTMLNNTLMKIIKLLNKHDITDWFVCYGTLLGLVRENNCIDGDDDIDIIVDKKYYDQIKSILLDNNFILCFDHGINDSKNILKTIPTKDLASIDIYMSETKEGKVYDIWNRLILTDCFLDNEKNTFIEQEWNGEKLYYPNNYVKILRNRYGDDWEIKQDKKVPQTMTHL